MNLLNSLFRWEAVKKLFRDDACLQAMLDFEAALARAESSAEVIPSSAVAAITAKCNADLFDQKKLAEAAALAGNLAIPLVKKLKELVAADNKDAANFVHWGATSQDAIDTAMILQCRAALALIAADANELCNALAKLADQHRATPIVGRTWMQHAVPTTLGMKFAGWLDALGRHRERLRQTQKNCLVLQFGGAVGTLAALGAKGEAVSQQLTKELNLAMPLIPWHSHRDRMAEIATTLGLLTGTLGKIARDISIHAQTEIDELRESAEDGRGGSSTMPHKRNPVASAAILSAAIRVPALVSTMLSAMVQEDERGMGGWHAEWETLPEIVCLAAGALHQLTIVVPNLEIDVQRMRRNLDLTNGLIFSEAITAALGKKIGRSQARKLLESASKSAAKEKLSLRKVLDENPEIKKHLSSQELEKLFNPGSYSGAASQFIDRVIQQHKSDTHSS